MANGKLTITDDDASSPQVVKLKGVGSLVNLSPTDPGVGFNIVTFGNPSTKTATFKNVGTTVVQISKVTIVGNAKKDFSQKNDCGKQLNAGQTCTLQVTFAPTPQRIGSDGIEIANLAIYANAPGSPHTVRLHGTGTAVGLSQRSLKFGDQGVGTSSAPQIIHMTNTGSTTLNLPGMRIVGEFSESDDCGGSLPPAAECTISVVFSPSEKGEKKGLLIVNSNDANSPQQLPLTGNGV